MEEYSGLQARYYDDYFTGIVGDVEFYLQAVAQVGSPVLELGCGSGRILIPVAQSGARIVGVERSASMLALLRPKLTALTSRQHIKAYAVRGDMRSFALREHFALALMPYRAFQHLLTDEDQRKCLCRIHQHLRPGAALVFNLFDPVGNLTEQREPLADAIFDRVDGGVAQVRYTRLIEGSMLRQQLIFDEFGVDGQLESSTETTLCLRCSSPAHIEVMLRSCGFEVSARYGGFCGEPQAEGGEQVWIAVSVG